MRPREKTGNNVLGFVSVVDRVGNAVVELNKANDYQKRSRTMLCIYLLLVLCGFMVIVLVLKKAALS